MLKQWFKSSELYNNMYLFSISGNIKYGIRLLDDFLYWFLLTGITFKLIWFSKEKVTRDGGTWEAIIERYRGIKNILTYLLYRIITIFQRSDSIMY